MDIVPKTLKKQIPISSLNALKFDESINLPKHINIDSIEHIAGEDMWEEFVSINLGSWSGSDIRHLSEQSGLKGIYDQHYSWTSGYAHGTWGAIRESCYTTCGNPLHRLHRYPSRKMLFDSVDDAAQLVDGILDDLEKAYSDFPYRITRKSNST